MVKRSQRAHGIIAMMLCVWAVIIGVTVAFPPQFSVHSVIAIPAIVLGGLGWVILIPGLYNNLKKEELEYEENMKRVARIFLTQAQVTSILVHHAEVFDAIAQREVRLQGAEAIDKQLETIKNEVAVTKETFWEARNLALDLGFIVENSYRAYLSDKTKTA